MMFSPGWLGYGSIIDDTVNSCMYVGAHNGYIIDEAVNSLQYIDSSILRKFKGK
jgi:hypothetical protein